MSRVGCFLVSYKTKKPRSNNLAAVGRLAKPLTLIPLSENRAQRRRPAKVAQFETATDSQW
jgi:hypothetical protein